MKKILYFLIGILAFSNLSSVSASTLISYEWENAFNSSDNIDYLYSIYSNNSNIINNLINYYDTHLSSNYNYYFITASSNAGNNFSICLHVSNSNVLLGFKYDNLFRWHASFIGYYCYSSVNNSYSYTQEDSDIYHSTNSYDQGIWILETSDNFIYSSNYRVQSNNLTDDSYYYPEKLIFPNYVSENFSINSFSISEGDIIPTVMTLYNNTFSPNNPSYQEINLNNFPYIALSLKDYTLRNDNNNQFSTNIYTKGQLCLTPVYNYGMTEKSSVYGSGYQVQGCSVYYDVFTPVRTYILKKDLENHAIYYIKAYDTSKDNIIKVDSSVFDISYVSSENADNPVVDINGKSYPTIAYDDLNSSSTISEEKGYVSGLTCSLGDLNCIEDSGISSWSDIFSSPLNALQSVWSSILSILSVISTFISLLPVTMQAFLYSSFGIAILLGVIKILI